MNLLAPIVLFTYKKVGALQTTIEALASNSLAADSDLIIYSDGAKDESDAVGVNEVRAYLSTIRGFKSITVNSSEVNKGLAASIISGVSEVITKYKKAIVLEDDLITSRNFLAFMNQGLNYYQKNSSVLSIAGYTPKIKGLRKKDVYFTKRIASWGWATWEDRWQQVDWSCKGYEAFINDAHSQSRFNRMGSDLTAMLKRQMTGKLNSWAIRFCFNQFRKNLYSIYPAVSKVVNIGFSAEASNTTMKYNPYDTELDDGKELYFNFSPEVKLENSIIKQFVRPWALQTRIKYKLYNMLLS